MADVRSLPRHWQLPWELPSGVHAIATERTWLDGEVATNTPCFEGFNLALHVGDDQKRVLTHRQRLSQSLSTVSHIQWLEQVHSAAVCEASTSSVTPIADACVTSQPGLACAVMTADCLPVLFCADDGSRVGAAHAGWRGLADGILLNTLAEFDPEHTRVYLAPAIGAQAFEVGQEVKDAFPWADSACFTRYGDKFLADLYALARQQLSMAGVRSISGNECCTVTANNHDGRPRYYSYRRDGQTGRQVSLIWRDAK